MIVKSVNKAVSLLSAFVKLRLSKVSSYERTLVIFKTANVTLQFVPLTTDSRPKELALRILPLIHECNDTNEFMYDVEWNELS